MLHDWPANKQEAFLIQDKLAPKVDLFNHIENPSLIAAVDTAYGVNGDTVYASVVVTSFPEIEEVEKCYHYDSVNFPYIPGFFYFREGPVIIEALSKLRCEPDVIIVRGHGIAHPRACGLACYIGMVFDKPSVGCARKLLAGRHREVPPRKGTSQPIVYKGREVGVAYRSKDKVKPVFISPGYKCDLEHAIDICVKNLRGYRQPEPLRLAHLYVNKLKRREDKKIKQREREPVFV